MTTITPPSKLQTRLTELNELSTFRPDLWTPRLEAEANQLAYLLMDLEEAEVIRAAAKAPESPEVQAYAAMIKTRNDHCRAYDARVGRQIGPVAAATRPRPIAASARGRSREARAGETRARGSRRTTSRSAGGGDPDLADSDEPPGGRLCDCGCGAPIGHRRRSALYLDDAHAARARQQRKRQKAKAEALARYERLARCESCGCVLSRYGQGGAQCWPCAFGGEAVEIPLIEVGLRELEAIDRARDRDAARIADLQRYATALGFAIGRERCRRLLEGGGARRLLRAIVARKRGALR